MRSTQARHDALRRAPSAQRLSSGSLRRGDSSGRFSEHDLDELLDTTAALLASDGGAEPLDDEPLAPPPPQQQQPRRAPSSAAAPAPPPPQRDAEEEDEYEDEAGAGQRYASRSGPSGAAASSGGRGVAGRRAWYNARARRGSDADPDEHSFRPRPAQRNAAVNVDPSDADAYYSARLRAEARDAAADWDEEGEEWDEDEEEWDEEDDEGAEDPYAHDARLAAETRRTMAAQRRAARHAAAEEGGPGGRTQQRLSGAAYLQDSDEEEERTPAAPLLDADILRKARTVYPQCMIAGACVRMTRDLTRVG